MGDPFPPTALQSRHAQTVKDSSPSYKIVYIQLVKTSLHPEGQQNQSSLAQSSPSPVALYLQAQDLLFCPAEAGTSII